MRQPYCIVLNLYAFDLFIFLSLFLTLVMASPSLYHACSFRFCEHCKWLYMFLGLIYVVYIFTLDGPLRRVKTHTNIILLWTYTSYVLCAMCIRNMYAWVLGSMLFASQAQRKMYYVKRTKMPSSYSSRCHISKWNWNCNWYSHMTWFFCCFAFCFIVVFFQSVSIKSTSSERKMKFRIYVSIFDYIISRAEMAHSA